jgi:hypothetical protein
LAIKGEFITFKGIGAAIVCFLVIYYWMIPEVMEKSD